MAMPLGHIINAGECIRFETKFAQMKRIYGKQQCSTKRNRGVKFFKKHLKIGVLQHISNSIYGANEL